MAHACARHGVCCMHVSFCMHFCRLQACAEAQVYLMQECHASVACNLHVHLYIWRSMRNMMRDHPSTTSTATSSKGPCLFVVYLSNHLAYALALFEDHLCKDHKQSSARLCNPVPDWVLAPFFPSCVSKEFPGFSFFRPFCCSASFELSKSPPHPSPKTTHSEKHAI